MQQQAPQTMNQASPAAINVVSTEQIQKFLDENKNLIVAILENQNLGKIQECAARSATLVFFFLGVVFLIDDIRYQAILQRNLMYLAAIADAQPPGSGLPSQLPNSLVPNQATAPGLQTQTPALQQQQQPKSPFQVNALRPQEQQNQLLQFQHQLPAHFGLAGVGGTSASIAFQGNQPGAMEGVSGDSQGNSGFGLAEGRE